MNDLKKATDISGTVYLYDIDFEAAQHNEIIGNRIDSEGWKYKAVRTIDEALTDADFVIISILPGRLPISILKVQRSNPQDVSSVPAEMVIAFPDILSYYNNILTIKEPAYELPYT